MIRFLAIVPNAGLGAHDLERIDTDADSASVALDNRNGDVPTENREPAVPGKHPEA